VTLLDRYVAATILAHFWQALAALTAVFAVVTLTEELRSVGSPGWGVMQVLWYVLLTVPNEAYALFSPAALLGTVLGLGRMASDSEIVALQASGISVWRIARAALVAGVLLAVAGAALGEGLAAPLSQRAHANRATALSGGRALSTSSGLWLRDGSRFVNVRALRPDGSFSDVYVFDLPGGRELERFAYAPTAVQTDGGWQLRDVHEQSFHGAASTRASTPWDFAIDPKQVRTLWLEPHDLSLVELGRTIRSLRAQDQNPLTYQVAFWRRLCAPVYMIVMVLLAVPMVMMSGRSIRVGERATLAALIGIGFQMFQEMFTNLGLVAAFPPVVIAVVPGVVASALAMLLYRRRTLQ